MLKMVRKLLTSNVMDILVLMSGRKRRRFVVNILGQNEPVLN